MTGHKTGLPRRALIAGAGSLVGLAACGNGVGNQNAAKIDARVDATRDFLIERYPGTQDLIDRAAGVLYIPLVTEVGFMFGGAYGRGARRFGANWRGRT